MEAKGSEVQTDRELGERDTRRDACRCWSRRSCARGAPAAAPCRYAEARAESTDHRRAGGSRDADGAASVFAQLQCSGVRLDLEARLPRAFLLAVSEGFAFAYASRYVTYTNYTRILYLMAAMAAAELYTALYQVLSHTIRIYRDRISRDYNGLPCRDDHTQHTSRLSSGILRRGPQTIKNDSRTPSYAIMFSN